MAAGSRRKKAKQNKIDEAMAWGGLVPDNAIKAEKNKARELKTSQWWKREISRGVCHYCGQKIPPDELTMDHVVPLVRGGKTTKGNVVPACKTCNSKKQSLVPVEWEEYLKHLQKP